jgi:hypothetical protein
MNITFPKYPTLFFLSYSNEDQEPVANFIVPDWGDRVDSGVGLLYRPDRLHRLAGRYDNTVLCISQL